VKLELGQGAIACCNIDVGLTRPILLQRTAQAIAAMIHNISIVRHDAHRAPVLVGEVPIALLVVQHEIETRACIRRGDLTQRKKCASIRLRAAAQQIHEEERPRRCDNGGGSLRRHEARKAKPGGGPVRCTGRTRFNQHTLYVLAPNQAGEARRELGRSWARASILVQQPSRAGRCIGGRNGPKSQDRQRHLTKNFPSTATQGGTTAFSLGPVSAPEHSTSDGCQSDQGAGVLPMLHRPRPASLRRVFEPERYCIDRHLHRGGRGALRSIGQSVPKMENARRSSHMSVWRFNRQRCAFGSTLRLVDQRLFLIHGIMARSFMPNSQRLGLRMTVVIHSQWSRRSVDLRRCENLTTASFRYDAAK
jgi:hypothetical protein